MLSAGRNEINEEALAMLERAQACHDDDPDAAALLLRALDPTLLPPERHPGLAFLFNHVLGEKLNAWKEADARQQSLLALAGDAAPAALVRQASAAATLVGDTAGAEQLSHRLAEALGISARQGADLTALTAAMYRAPAEGARNAARTAEWALEALRGDEWLSPGAADQAAAACMNNIASGLLERTQEDLRDPVLRAALEATAIESERLWQRAGTWVNHERAAYLRALTCTGLGDPAGARSHALRGLAILDENDHTSSQLVDRAFVELERAHACERLGLAEEAATAMSTAMALAADFQNAGVRTWFASRRAELAALAD